MDPRLTRRYSIQKLNFNTEKSWAVIEEPLGSVALTPSGQLMTRLSKDEANEIASQLNAQLAILAALPLLTMWPTSPSMS